MNDHNEIVGTVERKQTIATVSPTRHSVVQRAAASLSRRNVDAAVVEVMMEAAQRLTVLGYERDASGELCNIDVVTGRLLIPAPWGKVGYRQWGMTASESIILREMMQERQVEKEGRGPGLWLYDTSRRAWRLNLFDYDLPADGQRYWQRWPLGVLEYRAARGTRLGGRVEQVVESRAARR